MILPSCLAGLRRAIPSTQGDACTGDPSQFGFDRLSPGRQGELRREMSFPVSSGLRSV